MTFARIRALAIVGALVVAAVVFIVIAISKDRQANPAAQQNCASGSVAADLRLHEPKDIKLNVYNATDRPDLAKNVANDFKARKFTIGKFGNDPVGRAVDGVAVLRYGPKSVGSAWVVRAYFLNDADLEFDITRADDSVDVVLGTQFLQKQLGTFTEVNQALGAAGGAKLPPGTCDANAR